MTRFLIPTVIAGAITAIVLIFGAYVDAMPFDSDRPGPFGATPAAATGEAPPM